MMDYIAKALAALGEKIAALESTLSYKELLLAEAQKENDKLRKELAEAAGLVVTDTPKDEDW